MIDIHQRDQLTERRIWFSHVQQLFRTLGICDRFAAQEVGESLAVFCQQHTCMPEHALSLLMARSFCVAGDHEAAGRILRYNRACRPHTDSWLNILSAEYPFPELYPLFSSRALRPQRLASVGAMWVLDLGSVRMEETDRHELILFQTIRTLTEKVSCVWKKTDGQGTLGVKEIDRLVKFSGGRTARRLTGHIQDVLALCARKNSWSYTPSVLLLDL